MFLLLLGKSVFDSSSLVLLSLILFHLTVSGNEVTLPSTQREKIDEAIKDIGAFLRSEKGIEWLALTIKDRKSQLTTIDLVMAILDTESLEGPLWDAASVLKEALELKNDNIDLDFNKAGAKSNSTDEHWKSAVTDIDDEDDILCLYRKNTHDPEMKKSEDWRKLLDIAPGYAIHSVSDKGSKYLICLKKINITEMVTTTASTLITTTLPNEIEDQTTASEENDINDKGTEGRRKFDQTLSVSDENSAENLNNQTIGELNHDENTTNENDDDYEDCSSEELEEKDIKDDKNALKKVTPLYSGRSINHLPKSSKGVNPEKENSSSDGDSDENIERDELLQSRHHKKSAKMPTNRSNPKIPKKHQPKISNSRKSLPNEKLPSKVAHTNNKSPKQPRELESQDKPSFQIQMINTVQQSVPSHRMYAIPFVLYLRKLYAPEKFHLVNTMLNSFFPEKPPCRSNHQQILFRLLPSESDYREKPPCRNNHQQILFPLLPLENDYREQFPSTLSEKFV